ncbi:MAG: type IV pilin N-terminal domain-containing protein [Thermoplasmata archaeon]|nr:type IV pilin N-terminal domain-containing protein [Thermoplasmata archaeon]
MQKRTVNKNAVSAVIGVILMVAITIAMAAVAYAYFTGMIGGGNKVTPVINFIPSETDNTLTVSIADVDTNWADINITFSNGVGADYLEKTGVVSAGDTIYLETDQTLTGTVTVTFRHIPTNTMMGDAYTFQDVS